jgi:hypothetical protein
MIDQIGHLRSHRVTFLPPLSPPTPSREFGSVPTYVGTEPNSRDISSESPCLRGKIPSSVWDASDFE